MPDDPCKLQADYIVVVEIRQMIKWGMKKPRRVFRHGGVLFVKSAWSQREMGNMIGCLLREQQENLILRKEVIQPQVPLRLPCYDLVPIDRFAVAACLLAVGVASSGAPIFRGLTGGVYKAQEHIHRSVADLRLLAIPTS